MRFPLPLRLLALLVPLALLAQPAPPPQPSPLAQARAAVVMIQVDRGLGAIQQGSGVVFAPGLIATNAHVVKNAQTIRILKDSRSWVATQLCIAPDHDLVLLRVPGCDLAPVAAAPAAALRPELAVVAIGYPGGRGPTETRGRIASLWNYGGGRLIQADATTRPGSSGGGLFTEDGQLLGITTFVFPHSQNLNFSVPVGWVLALVASPLAASLQCPPMVQDYLLKDFTDLIAQDPANQTHWERLTRTWVQDSPADPDAWCALGAAIDGRLNGDLAATGQAPDPAEVLEAEAAFERTVALNPNHARAWNNLGATLDLRNRFPEAKRAYQEALRINPEYGLAWLNLGATLVNSRQYGEAAEALASGLLRLPDDAKAWALLAFCETSLQRWSEAAGHYRIALRYQPFRAEWWGERFKACSLAGEPEAAQAALQRLRALAPNLAAELERWARTLRPSGRGQR